MPIGDKAGIETLHEAEQVAIPQVGALISEIVTGAATATEGERLLFMDGMKPYLAEIVKLNNTAAELSATLKTAVQDPIPRRCFRQ